MSFTFYSYFFGMWCHILRTMVYVTDVIRVAITCKDLEALLLVSSSANVTFGCGHFTHIILQKRSVPNVSGLSQQQSRACCGAHTFISSGCIHKTFFIVYGQSITSLRRLRHFALKHTLKRNNTVE